MDKPEKLAMQTPNLTNDNFAALSRLFPNAVTETIDENGTVVHAIDADVLAQEINTRVVSDREERYQFTWPDKKKSVLLANAPISAALRPCREESVDFDTTENLYIEGDNLDVLKCLRETYLNKVKMIYIDPPYNTGNDFVYEDDFAGDADEFLSRDGQFDEQGNRLVKNLDSNGRFHTDWLNMMYPRLRVARDLLTEGGVIFISIDDNEVENLKKICNEVFGEVNFIADMVWAAGRKNDSKFISVSHEYIVCYARNTAFLREKNIEWRNKKEGLNDIYTQYEKLKKQYGDNYSTMTQKLKDWYKSLPAGHPAKAHQHYSNIDFRGVYFAADISWPGGGGPKYEVLHPVTKKPVAIPARGWMTSDPNKMQQWIKEDRVYFGVDETYVPCIKSYLRDHEYQTPYSVFYQDGRAATKRLRELMDGNFFDFPKDERILQKLVEMTTTSNDLILDFFSGSATTAHAVMQLNAEDGGTRKFIMVQLPELTDEKSEAYKAGYKNICEIGKERIRRAGKKIKSEAGLTAQNLDIGFRVLKLDSSNMKNVYYTPEQYEKMNFEFEGLKDNIEPDRTDEDLLFQVMLDLDIPLSAKITQDVGASNGSRTFSVNDNYLIACFGSVDIALLTEIAKKHPYYAVFRDSSFVSDSALVNFEQVFNTYSPNTKRKVL